MNVISHISSSAHRGPGQRRAGGILAATLAVLAALTSGPLAACARADSGAEADAPPGQTAATRVLERFALHGYASYNYFAFDWETDRDRRNQIDLERLTFELSCQLKQNVSLETEIEFEHGGTGASVEFDRFEEFGEFEYEIEKGGEIQVEELALTWQASRALSLSVGRVGIPIGLASALDEPPDYFTTTRSEMESSIIPVSWAENGVQASGVIGEKRPVSFTLSIVNGLDSSGFSSATWVARGHQTRFETVNAEDIALSLRADVAIAEETFVGASVYTGDSADNRPKPDLDANARVTILDVHGAASAGPLTARAVFLHGTLENADLVSRANRNLSNNLNVKRTPVGSSATGYVVEAGYDVRALVDALPARLDLFGRYERYDSMADVDGDIFDNPRWERSVKTVGANYHATHGVVLKGQYSHRRLGTATRNDETTISTGVGVEF